MDKEIWKDIEGYEGLYQVSNLGRVRSLVNTRGNMLPHPKSKKPQIDHGGYYVVKLSKQGIAKTVKIHRLVAIAFICNPTNKPQVNHIDGDKLNNNVKNLEWVTAKENMYHAFFNKLNVPLCGEEHAGAQLTQEQVFEIRKSYKKRDKNFGVTALAKKYNVSTSIISCVVLNKTYTSKEYIPNISHKLTNEEIKEIRLLYNNKDTSFGITALAKKYNVSPYTIRGIVKNKTYIDKHYKAPSLNKLNPDEIAEIKKTYLPRSKTANLYSLAKKYNVSASHIFRIIHNQAYK